jgi:hypothetical protein
MMAPQSWHDGASSWIWNAKAEALEGVAGGTSLSPEDLVMPEGG